MPRCLFRTLTGCDCPACGAQRAVSALLHGDPAAAFWHNPYLALLTPYLAVLLGSSLGNGRTALRLRHLTTHPITILCIGSAMVGWWIVRNTQLWAEIRAAHGFGE
ncbi:MAG: DUF2752 domain-containing protein [Alistipes sp.]|nr:DUF2752 domain-containing protein [Alistipes sp.]